MRHFLDTMLSCRVAPSSVSREAGGEDTEAKMKEL